MPKWVQFYNRETIRQYDNTPTLSHQVNFVRRAQRDVLMTRDVAVPRVFVMEDLTVMMVLTRIPYSAEVCESFRFCRCNHVRFIILESLMV